MLNAQLAFNEQTKILYYGLGTGGAGGTATQAIAIGGDGAFATISYVDSAVAGINLSSYLTVSAASSTYLTQSTASSTYAPLSSPALTGSPTAPTVSGSTDNSTKIATTAFVQAVVAALVNSAPGTLDTLAEIAAALGSDPNFATTITTALAGKLAAASNLSDLANAATARTNLGLGSMATQAASNVNITGGSIDNITLDAGTF
jgi:hypothetical protein